MEKSIGPQVREIASSWSDIAAIVQQARSPANIAPLTVELATKRAREKITCLLYRTRAVKGHRARDLPSKAIVSFQIHVTCTYIYRLFHITRVSLLLIEFYIRFSKFVYECIKFLISLKKESKINDKTVYLVICSVLKINQGFCHFTKMIPTLL